MLAFFEAIGRPILTFFSFIGATVILCRDTIFAFRRLPRFRHVFLQMAHLGVDSLFIVALTLLFTGMVMTLQVANEFIRFGAQSTIGAVIAIAVGRELGPVLVGVVTAGRVGAAITAEISTMKVTEQIDALKVMATSPVHYLVVPRVLACTLMLPLLTIFGDMIGILGGYIIATKYSGISSFLYLNSIQTYAVLYDLTGGLIKAAIFGVVIAILGSHAGLNAPNGAEGVGKATTKSVVTSIITIFVLNCFLSLVLYK